MARVSLIVLRSPGISWPSDRVAGYRAGLQEQGHSVEVVAASDPSTGPSGEAVEPWCEPVVAVAPGLAESAIAGLRAARGDLLVVVDLAIPYAPEAVTAVVESLARTGTPMVVAARPRPWTGPLSTRFLGTADPTSGLVGLARAAAREADDSFAPVGSRFALELLARVPGGRLDVEVGPVKAAYRGATPFGDLRQAKRLADDRFGNASRLIQFCLVGASGMVVDLTCYATFQATFARTPLAGMEAPLVGGPMAIVGSAVLAIALALTWNFSINRRLTFNDARRGSIAAQYLRYALSNLLGIGVSLSLRLLLPTNFGFFGRHRLAAAVVGIVAATGISFSMARWFVFGRRQGPAPGRPLPPARRRCAGFRPPRPARPRPHPPLASTAPRAARSENVTN